MRITNRAEVVLFDNTETDGFYVTTKTDFLELHRVSDKEDLVFVVIPKGKKMALILEVRDE